MNIRSASILALLAALPGAAATAQPAQPAPTSAWAVEPSPLRCVASRGYGDARAPLTLGIKAPPIGDGLQLVLLRPGHRSRAEQTGATIAIGPRIVRTSALSYPLDPRGRRVADLVNLSAEDALALRGADTIEIRVAGASRSFALAPSERAWTQLDACLQRLRRDWSVGPSLLASWPEPIAPLASLFSDADYPIRMLMAGQSGSVRVVLLIDEQGQVKDCTLTETSGIASLDALACATLLARARFRPATDRDRRPARSSIRTGVHWVMDGPKSAKEP